MKDATQLIIDASFEIKRLRKENEIMRARLNMFDDMMILLNTKPFTENQCLSEDIGSQLEKYIEEKKK